MKALYERWSSRETESVRRVYTVLDREALEERFGRAAENIRYKARKLGIKKRKPRFAWSAEDDRVLEPFVRERKTLNPPIVENRTRRAILSRILKLRTRSR